MRYRTNPTIEFISGIMLIGLLIFLVGCSEKGRTIEDIEKEFYNNLPNDSYTIDRHYDECILNNTIFYVEFNPFEEWDRMYDGSRRSNESIFEEFAYSFGIPVECPKNKYLIGYEFCYKKWISCNQTRYYKNGTIEKMIYAII